MSDDRCEKVAAVEAEETVRALMEREARILRSYAERAKAWHAFHPVWTELAEDLEDWISGWPTQRIPAAGPQPGRTAHDAVHALERAVATAEQLRADAASDAHVLAVLDLKGTELDALRLVRRTALMSQSRERIVLGQILRLAEILVRHSNELHVHLKTLEVIQHLRVQRSATG